MNIIRYQLTDQQYITDANIGLNEQDYITHVSADTGLGKSTWVMESLGKQSNIIFSVPQRAQITQLQAKYQSNANVSFFYGGHREDIEPTRIIVCTYDQLPYVQSLIYTAEYLLVIDEVHKLYQAASYRPDAIAGMLEAIQDRRFANVVTLSATFTPELVPFPVDTWIEVKGSQITDRRIDLHIHSEIAALEDAVLSAAMKSERPIVIRINNKVDIQAYRNVMEAKGMKCLAISSDAQNSDAVQAVLTSESIASYDVILTTSLLDEAINICDIDINDIMVLNSRIHPEELKQFVGRFRRCNPVIKLYTLHSLFGGKRKAVDDQRRDKLAIAKAAKQLANLMRDECDVAQAVRKANATLCDMFGFEPLRVNRSEIVANEPAIMAALYQGSVRQCYLNAGSLETILGEYFQSLTFSVTQPPGLVNSLNDALFDAAYDSVDKEQQLLINSCRNDVECETRRTSEQSDEPIDPLKVLERCRARYQSESNHAVLFNRWIALSREVFIDFEEAIDAIVQCRERDVWRFHKDVEGNIYIRPMLKQLMKLPIGTTLTLNEARSLLLKSLSLATKDYPPFKDIVQAANVSGLSVKRNNHFDVSDSFVRKVFRKYTATPPVRSNNKDKIVFSGVGLFGYQYRLKSLQQPKAKAGVRRIRRIKTAS